MNRANTFRGKWDFLVLVIALALILAGLPLGGCTRGSLPGGDAPGVSGPGAIVTSIGTIALSIGSAGLVACAFLAWFYPNKFTVAKLATACLTLLAAGTLLHILGQHMGALLGCVLVASAGYLAYRHVGRLEKALGVDINRDGKVGR